MAEATTAPAAPQASVEAPAAAAPASTSDVTAWAKAEGLKLEQAAAVDTPAATTPDATEKPAATDAGTSTTEGAEPEAEKLSRRQRDEQRRAEIRAEVETEIATRTRVEQETNERTRIQREAEESLLTTIAKAKAGDYAAALQLAQTTEQQLVTLPKQTQREHAVYQAGRDAVLSAMAADFEPTVKAIEGIDDAAFATLAKAPTSGAFAKAAIDIGRGLERAALESKLATLQAENTSLKGRLAASGPSPLHANGSNGRGTLPTGAGMRDIAAQVAAEMGLSL